jgi:hypothetical protein
MFHLRTRLFDQNYLPPISVEAGHFRTISMSLPAHMFVLSSWEFSRNTSTSLAAYGAERPDGAGADHTIMPKSAKRSRLSPMSALDKANAKMGRGALKPLGAGIQQTWKTRVGNVSPAYLTRWRGAGRKGMVIHMRSQFSYRSNCYFGVKLGST